MKGVIWLAIPMVLAACDLLRDRYTLLGLVCRK